MAAATRIASWAYWARILLYVLVAAGILVTVLPASSADAWWVRTLDFPRVQFLVALLILLALLLALPGRFRAASVAASVAAAACAAWQAVVLFPYTPLRAVQMVSTGAACADGHRLRLLAANVQMTNENAERLFALIRRTGPDLILLQETDAWWDDRLRALSGEWPHAAQQVTQNYFGMHILSRYALVDPEVHFLSDSRNASIFTGVALPAGPVVRFYGVHPRPPLPGQSSAERDAQLLGAALAMREDERPRIAAGDFNAVPWEGAVERMRRVGGLLAPRIGRGWMPTFRTGSWLVTWPLDHVLAGPRFSLTGIEVLPDVGSDHYPIMAEFCHAPQVAAEQSAPAVDAGDIAAARSALAAGQNRAESSPEPAPGKQQPQ